MSTTKCVKLHFWSAKHSYGFKDSKSSSEIPGLTQKDIEAHNQKHHNDNTKLRAEEDAKLSEIYKKIEDT